MTKDPKGSIDTRPSCPPRQADKFPVRMQPKSHERFGLGWATQTPAIFCKKKSGINPEASRSENPRIYRESGSIRTALQLPSEVPEGWAAPAIKSARKKSGILPRKAESIRSPAMGQFEAVNGGLMLSPNFQGTSTREKRCTCGQRSSERAPARQEFGR